jgi:hypothetical protein
MDTVIGIKIGGMKNGFQTNRLHGRFDWKKNRQGERDDDERGCETPDGFARIAA